MVTRRQLITCACLGLAAAATSLGCTNQVCWDNVWVDFEVERTQLSEQVDLRGISEFDGSLVVVGAGGFVARQPADGDSDPAGSWSTVDSPTQTDLLALATSDDLLLAVGRDGVVLRSIDGLAWSSVDAETSSDLWDVDIDGAMALVVGDDVILHSHDAGLSWTSASLPALIHPALRGVEVHEGSAWAVGIGGVILTSSDDGASWTPFTEIYGGPGSTNPASNFSVDLWDVGTAGRSFEGLFAVGDDKILRFDDDQGRWYVPDLCHDFTCMDSFPPMGKFRRVAGNYIVGLEGRIVIVEDEREAYDYFDESGFLEPVDLEPDEGGLWATVGDLAVGDDGQVARITSELMREVDAICVDKREEIY